MRLILLSAPFLLAAVSPASALCFPPSKYLGEIQLQKFLEYLECKQAEQDNDIQGLLTSNQEQQREIDALREELDTLTTEFRDAERQKTRDYLRSQGVNP
ncbi:hypothetical protein G6M12_08475 [Agrobacterium tumefaciens]|nr:hypothetical protein [Agrobacterium tumefaciens]